MVSYPLCPEECIVKHIYQLMFLHTTVGINRGNFYYDKQNPFRP